MYSAHSLLKRTDIDTNRVYKIRNPARAKGLSINQLRNINAYYRAAEEEEVLDKFERHFGELLANSYNYLAGRDLLESLVLENQ